MSSNTTKPFVVGVAFGATAVATGLWMFNWLSHWRERTDHLEPKVVPARIKTSSDTVQSGSGYDKWHDTLLSKHAKHAKRATESKTSDYSNCKTIPVSPVNKNIELARAHIVNLAKNLWPVSVRLNPKGAQIIGVWNLYRTTALLCQLAGLKCAQELADLFFSADSTMLMTYAETWRSLSVSTLSLPKDVVRERYYLLYGESNAVAEHRGQIRQELRSVLRQQQANIIFDAFDTTDASKSRQQINALIAAETGIDDMLALQMFTDFAQYKESVFLLLGTFSIDLTLHKDVQFQEYLTTTHAFDFFTSSDTKCDEKYAKVPSILAPDGQRRIGGLSFMTASEQRRSYGHFQNNAYLELPCENKDFRLGFILPDIVQFLLNYERDASELTGKELKLPDQVPFVPSVQEHARIFQETEMSIIRIPKAEITSTLIDLKPILQNLGVNALFTETDALSVLFESKASNAQNGLNAMDGKVSHAYHQVKLKWTESKVQAVAATVYAGASTGCVIDVQKKPSFIANRPFWVYVSYRHVPLVIAAFTGAT